MVEVELASERRRAGLRPGIAGHGRNYEKASWLPPNPTVTAGSWAERDVLRRRVPVLLSFDQPPAEPELALDDIPRP
jgi:hypothetical protein